MVYPQIEEIMKIELLVIGVTIALFWGYHKYKKVKQDFLFMKRSDFYKKYGHTGL